AGAGALGATLAGDSGRGDGAPDGVPADAVGGGGLGDRLAAGVGGDDGGAGVVGDGAPGSGGHRIPATPINAGSLTSASRLRRLSQAVCQYDGLSSMPSPTRSNRRAV